MTVLRDVRERARDVEGIVKQWFAFVKPNFEKVYSIRVSPDVNRKLILMIVRRAPEKSGEPDRPERYREPCGIGYV